MILTIRMDVGFEVSHDELDEHFIDQQTGEVHIDRIADAMEARLGRRESHYLQVIGASAR